MSTPNRGQTMIHLVETTFNPECYGKKGYFPIVNHELPKLELKFLGKSLSLNEFDRVFSIGREKSNDLVIYNPVVSRCHARIELNDEEGFVLINLGLNGCCVEDQQGNVASCYHRQVLRGKGVIVFGANLNNAPLETVEFELRTLETTEPDNR